MTAAAGPAPSRRVTAVNVTDHPAGGSQIGVVGKRTYLIRHGRCVPADEQVALVEAPTYDDDRATLLHDMDVALNRRMTDVVLVGKARAPRAQSRSFEIRIRAGTLDRRLMVFGDRRCARTAAGQVRFSEPDPVDEVDLGWASAYGGVDRVALAKHGDPLKGLKEELRQPYNACFGRFAYPRNRAGKGYLLETSDQGLEACALPNLEDPFRLLEPERLAVREPGRWPDAPLPAGLGWLSYGSFPRSAMLGVPPAYDPTACPPDRFVEVKLGVLQTRSIAPVMPMAERLDLAAAQQSAVGMRAAEVGPGTDLEVQNCHPRETAWRFRLPGDLPVFALQMPGAQPVSLRPAIRTLLLEPEHDRVCLVWVAEHQEPTPIGPGKTAHIKHGVEWRA